MRPTALLIAALAVATEPWSVNGSGSTTQNQVTTFGGENPPPQQAQWLPATSSYSNGPYKRAIFLTFDGMHQFDLTNWVARYPNSTFASLLKNAVVYSNARASQPSDSLPATAALFTGAFSRSSGIFWEQTWDRELYTGGTNCTGTQGGLVDYSEAADMNSSALDGGGAFNLTYLPQQKTRWGTCEPVYPHNYLRVNTIFEVARGNGLLTAYADKHPSYEFLAGPSGVGLSQGYFPEIASIDSTLQAQEAWDDLHWSALRNWTNGNWANGTINPSGAPSLYAANFQAITWAQAHAGYLDAIGTPNATLEAAFKKADAELGSFVQFLKSQGKLDSTLLMFGSKQGQGPINPKTEYLIDPSLVQDAVSVPVTFFNGEDGGFMFLERASDAPTAKRELLSNATLGITYVLAGDEVAGAGFGSPFLDSRVPDLIIGVNNRTLWNSGFEFEDHGGFLPQDLNVPLFAYNPKLAPKNITEVVANRQVASTLLQALGLPLAQLDGYRLGQAPVLPNLFT